MKCKKLFLGLSFLKNVSSLFNRFLWGVVGGLSHSIGALSLAPVFPTYR